VRNFRKGFFPGDFSSIEMESPKGSFKQYALRRYRLSEVRSFIITMSPFYTYSPSQGAIRTVYGPHKSTWPGLTFFVVGKRHHVRFLPENGDRDQQGNNNCYSGFVVDRDIVHPVHPDFYLQSHPGLKGSKF